MPAQADSVCSVLGYLHFSSGPSPPAAAPSATELKEQVDALRSALSDTRAELQRSHEEVTELRKRLDQLEAHLGTGQSKAAPTAPPAAPSPAYPTLEEALKVPISRRSRVTRAGLPIPSIGQGQT